MFSLKKLYRRFKAWQVHPADYPVADVPRYCNNCGYEYTGNFCPVCGQRATAGRVTWNVVRHSVMDVWGLGGRSLPYSLWQLMWRPGYFISDYINGKWQSSFPPVKMLVLVAVILFLVGKAIFPEYWAALIEYDPGAITSTGWQYYFDFVSQWIGNHIEWLYLFIFSLLILPTWLVFRHSPRNPRHTIPQGFFIQVLMTTQYFVWVFIISTFVKLVGIDLGYEAGSSGFEDIMVESSLLVIPVIVAVNYKQVFGYGWWGTVWRVLLMVMVIVSCFFAIALWYSVTTKPEYVSKVEEERWLLRLLGVFCISCSGLMLSMADVINRKLWRERGRLRAMALPLLFLVSFIIIAIAMEVIRPGVLWGMIS